MKQPTAPKVSLKGPVDWDALWKHLLVREAGVDLAGNPIKNAYGAMGKAQIKPEIAKSMVENFPQYLPPGTKYDAKKLMDKDQSYNETMGRGFFNYLKDVYKGDPVKVLGAYNQGEKVVNARVAAAKGDPNWFIGMGAPLKSGEHEGQHYIASIANRYNMEKSGVVGQTMAGVADAVQNLAGEAKNSVKGLMRPQQYQPSGSVQASIDKIRSMMAQDPNQAAHADSVTAQLPPPAQKFIPPSQPLVLAPQEPVPPSPAPQADPTPQPQPMPRQPPVLAPDAPTAQAPMPTPQPQTHVPDEPLVLAPQAAPQPQPQPQAQAPAQPPVQGRPLPEPPEGLESEPIATQPTDEQPLMPSAPNQPTALIPPQIPENEGTSSFYGGHDEQFVRPSRWQNFTHALDEGFMNADFGAYDWLKNRGAQFAGAVLGIPKISPDEANERFPGMPVPWTTPVDPYVAQLQYDNFKAKNARDEWVVRGNADHPWQSWGAGFMGGMVNPVNLALVIASGGTSESVAALSASRNFQRIALHSLGMSAGMTGAEYAFQAQDHLRDLFKHPGETLADYARDTAVGAGQMVGLHYLFGAVGFGIKVMKDVPDYIKEKATKTAVAQAEAGAKTDAAPQNAEAEAIKKGDIEGKTSAFRFQPVEHPSDRGWMIPTRSGKPVTLDPLGIETLQATDNGAVANHLAAGEDGNGEVGMVHPSPEDKFLNLDQLRAEGKDIPEAIKQAKKEGYVGAHGTVTDESGNKKNVLHYFEKDATIQAPKDLYNEWWALERDILRADGDDGSQPGRAEFVDALEGARKTADGYEMDLPPIAQEFLKSENGALGAHMDIWKDLKENGNPEDGVLLDQAEAMKKLAKKLPGESDPYGVKPFDVQKANPDLVPRASEEDLKKHIDESTKPENAKTYDVDTAEEVKKYRKEKPMHMEPADTIEPVQEAADGFQAGFEAMAKEDAGLADELEALRREMATEEQKKNVLKEFADCVEGSIS